MTCYSRLPSYRKLNYVLGNIIELLKPQVDAMGYHMCVLCKVPYQTWVLELLVVLQIGRYLFGCMLGMFFLVKQQTKKEH